MEPQTRFDLTQAISRWRMELAEIPGIATADVSELETHLSDSLAARQKSGCFGKVGGLGTWVEQDKAWI